MSVGFQHPNVKVHVGDGFKFLEDYKDSFDVITTQAENPWLHMKMIVDLKKSVKSVFPVAEYGWTTIPTYPAGQIGFMVCCKDASRDVRKPLRKLSEEQEDKLFKYYSSKVHEAAFVLPKFAEKALR